MSHYLAEAEGTETDEGGISCSRVRLLPSLSCAMSNVQFSTQPTLAYNDNSLFGTHYKSSLFVYNIGLLHKQKRESEKTKFCLRELLLLIEIQTQTDCNGNV